VRSQVRRTIILSIVLIAVGGVGMALSFYILYLDGVKSAEQRLTDLRKEVDRLKQLKEGLKVLERQIQEAKINEQKARSRIPALGSGEFENLVRHLYKVSNDTQVNLQTPRSVPMTGGGRWRGKQLPAQIHAATYEVTVTGDFYRLWDFVSVMERSTRYVDIESFAITPYKAGAEPEGGPVAGVDRQDSAKLVARLTSFAAEGPAGASGARPPPPPKRTSDSGKGEKSTTPPPE
jgi:hypothetical protein